MLLVTNMVLGVQGVCTLLHVWLGYVLCLQRSASPCGLALGVVISTPPQLLHNCVCMTTACVVLCAGGTAVHVRT